MKISVVIPAYNAAKTIRQTLESCLQQSYPPHEIWIVDDCSTDNTTSVVKEYASVNLITLTKNAGPSACRNAGWGAATGDIIAFLDADDVWHPEKLDILNKVFGAHATLKFLGHPYTLKSFGEPIPEVSLVKQCYLSILISNPFQSSCISVRRDIDELFDPSFRYCEDQEFALRVAYKYGCFNMPVPLTKLGRPQLTEGGASGNHWKMRKGELKAYSAIWKSNPLFALAIPALWLFSFAKHIRKQISHS